MRTVRGLCLQAGCDTAIKRMLALCVALMTCFASRDARASGPRFVSGTGIWVQAGLGEGWNTTQLLYYTDPGALSSSVSHAQADTMVAAAAAVWNVNSSSISVGQGGELAEHVSSENSYFDGNEFVFPADVEAANEGSIPVAVIYDADGSVTDLLLGSGASEPIGCRQNAVTQSVDDIQPDGHIHHAIVVINGRCVGSAAQDLTQMQYQLARAFGRILGLAWSQTNDNVFTAMAQVTADQETYWPVMHPLDVICGTYTYQCMSNPFTLRPDDLNGLANLYPILANNVPAGKQASDTDASWLYVISNFPTGQGMDWQNFTARCQHGGVVDDFEIVSAISGNQYQEAMPSAVTGTEATNAGSPYQGYQEGLASMRVVPIGGLANVFLTSEPINPLYAGEYALGPYVRPPVTPSGSPQTWVAWSAVPYPDNAAGGSVTAWDGASSCAPGDDGAEGAPATFDPSGWQNGQLCGWGHSSWWTATVRAGRSWTLEVTATDETGSAATNKAQPVVGIWNAGDPTGTLPTVANVAVPFNSMAFGVTQLQMPVASTDTPLRFVIGDEFGGGRPDFTYGARLLYADSVSPRSVGAGGGTITINGTGFRQGNEVQVNGVAAVVKSWTATQIVAVAPPFAQSGATVGTAVNVSVMDTTTGGSTNIASALTYTTAPDLLQLVSAPTNLDANEPAAIPFAVRVLASDGITPVARATVRFSVTNGEAALQACGTTTSCEIASDSNGLAQTQMTAGGVGTVVLTATEMSGGATVQVTSAVTPPVQVVTFANPAQYVAAGANASWPVQLNVTQDGSAVAGVAVNWTAAAGLSLNPAAQVTTSNGEAQATVSSAPLAANAVETLVGCGWSTVCATWTLHSVDASDWQIAVATGAGQSVPQNGTLGSVSLVVTDGAGHPLQGAPVTVYQRVLGWEGQCGMTGRCPAAPVLASAHISMVSDVNGNLTLTPLQVAGRPQTVEIAASTGLQGFVVLTLVKAPGTP